MSEQQSFPYTNKGNLARQPELKTTSSGKLLAKCAIAIHGKSRTEGTGDAASFTSFFEVEAWGDVAETFAKLNKGDYVEVKGDFTQPRWIDNDGKKKSTVKFILQAFNKLTRQPRQGEQPA